MHLLPQVSVPEGHAPPPDEEPPLEEPPLEPEVEQLPLALQLEPEGHDRSGRPTPAQHTRPTAMQ